MDYDKVTRRLAAILAADAGDYGQLMSEDEESALATLRTTRSLIDSRIDAHGGRIFGSTGNSFVATFPSVVDAVRCGMAIQDGLAERRRVTPADAGFAYRLGINLGDIIIDGTEVYGDGVNIAARLEQIAEPGSVFVSGGVYDQVKNKLPLAFEDLGFQRLRNILEPVRVYRVRTGVTGDPLEPPSVELPDRPSIAVLPFENRTGDPGQQYFSDGITEDIITELSRFRSLMVIARSTSFAYRGRDNLPEIGRTLGVRYVLVGSVRRSGERVRITAQLLEAETGRSLWGTRQDCTLAELFTIQDEVVRAIVAALPGRVEEDWFATTRLRRTENLAAYDYVLRAWDLLYRRGGTEHAAIRALLERAIALDPAYAQAHALMGFTLVLAWYRDGDPATLERAYQAARRAVDLEEMDGWCHFALGYALLYRRAFDLAELHYNKAVALNPNDAELLSQMGAFLPYLGRPEEGIEWIRRAMRLNPNRIAWHWQHLGFALLSARRHEEAIAAFGRVIPALPFDDVYLAVCKAHCGRLEEARNHAQAALAHHPRISITTWGPTEPYRDPAQLEHFLDGMRKAGFPE